MKLEDFSPLYGALTGKGAMGALTSQGLLGRAASAVRDRQKDEEEERNRRSSDKVDVEKPQPLVTKKKGGMIKSSASKRADGCAKKGKTKGRFV